MKQKIRTKIKKQKQDKYQQTKTAPNKNKHTKQNKIDRSFCGRDIEQRIIDTMFNISFPVCISPPLPGHKPRMRKEKNCALGQ